MKVVINTCFGGFSLSPLAVKRLAELNGRECYFYKDGLRNDYKLIGIDEANSLFWSAFDVPNINDILPEEHLGEDGTYKDFNNLYKKHRLVERPEDRTDPKLIQVVEELGSKANGACANLRIVEIPDGIEWEIDEYDGIETIHETHRSWS